MPGSKEVSLRDSLESAIKEVEAKEPPPIEAAPPPPDTEVEEEEVKDPPTEEGKEVEEPPPEAQEAKAKVPEPTSQVEPAPKSWKAAALKSWGALPPDVRKEVLRREAEISKSFGENNQVREFHKQFSEVIRPFEARIQSIGFSPIQAVHELLKADHILSTAPAVQRAKFMAQLIQEYGVDIRELDSALAGVAPADPVRAQLETMLAEKLNPLNSFITQQQQIARQQQIAMNQEAVGTIDKMAENNKEFPHFETVRQDMADIIEISAKRGVYITPQQAYTRAVAMNPDLAAQAESQRVAAAQRQQAQNSSSRAQRALNASASISGAPGGTPVGVNPNGSLRETIEAAFDQVQGR